MSFVAAAASVGTWAGLTGTAAVIGGGAMIGAGVGGAYSALTGDGNILDSMLTGATIGGLGGWAMAPAAAAPTVGTATSGLTGTGALGTSTGQLATATNTPALAAYGEPVTTSNILANQKIASGSFGLDPSAGSYGFGNMGATNTGFGINTGLSSSAPSSKSWLSSLSNKEKLGYGLGATTLLGMLGGQSEGVNVPTEKGMIRPYEYSTARREPEAGKPYYFEPIEYDQYGRTTKPLDTAERNYFDQKFTALPTYAAANGGQVPPNLNNMPAGGLASLQGMRDGYSPMTTMDGSIPQFGFGGIIARAVGLAEADNSPPRYSFDPQTRRYTQLNSTGNQPELNYENIRGNLFDGNLIRKLFDQANQSQQQSNPQYSYDASNQTYTKMANGGHLGGYSDGGQLLRGPGDGVSDDIPASINDKQPARLADGEFVIPARIVSELGNGSTDAGAKRLYGMMDRIQADRSKTVGKGKVAVDSKARKHLPA